MDRQVKVADDLATKNAELVKARNSLRRELHTVKDKAGNFASRPKRKRVATENAFKPLNPDQKRALYHCNYCQKDITNVVRIKCAVCSEVDLCVECFSTGAEITPHKNDHDYRIIDNLTFPLFTPDWSAEDELLLLEAIEMYGLGNWTEVAEHVGTKTKAACRSHYFSTYINVPTAPLPDLENAGSQRLQGAPETKVGPNSSDITGYHAKRNEFDPEYDNDAEIPLAEMEFGPNDTPEEYALKVRMLNIYNDRLAERARRKQFILERGLLNVKRLQAQERKRSKEERDLYNRFAVFARFQSQAEHEALLEGLVAEQRLRMRIEELKEARRVGIHTMQEFEVYDAEKRRREVERARLKSLGYTAGYAPLPGGKSTLRANRYLMRDGLTPQLSFPSSGTPRELQKLQTGGPGGSGSSAGGSSGAAGKGKKVTVPLDLTGLPGVDKLAAREQELGDREFCGDDGVDVGLSMGGMVDVGLSGVDMGDAWLSGVDMGDVGPSGVDPNKVVRIYEWLLSCGLVTEEPALQATGSRSAKTVAAAAAPTEPADTESEAPAAPGEAGTTAVEPVTEATAAVEEALEDAEKSVDARMDEVEDVREKEIVTGGTEAEKEEGGEDEDDGDETEMSGRPSAKTLPRTGAKTMPTWQAQDDDVEEEEEEAERKDADATGAGDVSASNVEAMEVDEESNPDAKGSGAEVDQIADVMEVKPGAEGEEGAEVKAKLDKNDVDGASEDGSDYGGAGLVPY
eukprot:gene618-1044_t